MPETTDNREPCRWCLLLHSHPGKWDLPTRHSKRFTTVTNNTTTSWNRNDGVRSLPLSQSVLLHCTHASVHGGNDKMVGDEKMPTWEGEAKCVGIRRRDRLLLTSARTWRPQGMQSSHGILLTPVRKWMRPAWWHEHRLLLTCEVRRATQPTAELWGEASDAGVVT